MDTLVPRASELVVKRVVVAGEPLHVAHVEIHCRQDDDGGGGREAEEVVVTVGCALLQAVWMGGSPEAMGKRCSSARS